MAPATLVALTLALTAVQLTVAGVQAGTREREIAAAASASAALGVPPGTLIAADHPIWLSAALDIPVVAVPHESAHELVTWVRAIKPAAVALVDDDAATVAALRASGCFAATAPSATVDPSHLAIFVNTGACK
jgi:hypothetical protein